MATGLTTLDILQATLDVLSQTRAITQTELTNNSQPEARWFNRVYPRTVRALLRSSVWTFAKGTAEVTKDTTNPSFDWSYRYALPSDWVRLLPLTRGGLREGDLIPFELFGSWLHTDDAGPLKMRGVQDMQDPDDWDHLFVDVVIGRLAVLYAPKLTGKVNYSRMAKEYFDDAFALAEQMGAIEEWPEPVEEHDIIRVRG